MEDSYCERCLCFIFHHSLWSVVTKMASEPFLLDFLLLTLVVFQSPSLILSMPPSWHPSLLSLLSHFHHLSSPLFLLLTLFSPSPIHSDSLRPETVLLAMCMMEKACAASPTAASLHLAPTKLICFFGRPWRMSELMIIFCLRDFFSLFPVWGQLS